MNRIIIAVLFLSLGLGVGLLYGKYEVGPRAYKAGEAAGTEQGNRSGYETGLSAGKAISSLEAELAISKWQEDYNKLANDYNALLNYANTPRYQPKQTISCTSSTLGFYFPTTYTNCY